jgi:hypothetical protein
MFARYRSEYHVVGDIGFYVVAFESKVPTHQTHGFIPVGLTIEELDKFKPKFVPARFEVAVADKQRTDLPLPAYESAITVAWDMPHPVIVYDNGKPRFELPDLTDFTLAFASQGVVLGAFHGDKQVNLDYAPEEISLIASRFGGGVDGGLRRKLDSY